MILNITVCISWWTRY